MIRNCWYVAGFSEEFEEADVQGHTITGRPIVMWRAGSGEVTALDGRCAHKRFPLAEGRLLDNGALECAYHGFAYDTTGRCTAIPALRERTDRIPETASLHRFPIIEQDGVVWIWPGDPSLSDTNHPPRMPEVGSDEWETHHTERMHVDASARLLIENLCDLTHFYPLHSTTNGTYEDASLPVEIERDTADGLPVLSMTRRRRDFRFSAVHSERFGIEVGDIDATHQLIGPGIVKATISYAPAGRLGTEDAQTQVLYHTIVPIDEESHVWRRSTQCRAGSRYHGDPRRSLLEVTVEGSWPVIEEDRWALEQQQKMLRFPDEGYREVHIKTDGGVVIARRLLEEMERAESAPAADGHAAGTNGARSFTEAPRRRAAAAKP